jgi:translation initiation factor 1 (eIF-1/SUI1)
MTGAGMIYAPQPPIPTDDWKVRTTKRGRPPVFAPRQGQRGENDRNTLIKNVEGTDAFMKDLQSKLGLRARLYINGQFDTRDDVVRVQGDKRKEIVEFLKESGKMKTSPEEEVWLESRERNKEYRKERDEAIAKLKAEQLAGTSDIPHWTDIDFAAAREERTKQGRPVGEVAPEDWVVTAPPNADELPVAPEFFALHGNMTVRVKYFVDPPPAAEEEAPAEEEAAAPEEPPAKEEPALFTQNFSDFISIPTALVISFFVGSAATFAIHRFPKRSTSSTYANPLMAAHS